MLAQRATKDPADRKNTAEVARSGSVVPLFRRTRSKDEDEMAVYQEGHVPNAGRREIASAWAFAAAMMVVLSILTVMG